MVMINISFSFKGLVISFCAFALGENIKNWSIPKNVVKMFIKCSC